MSVLVFVEIDNGSIKKSSQEALFYGSEVAKSTGSQVVALAITSASESALTEAGHYGAAKVLQVSDSRLEAENSVAYADILAQAAQFVQAKVIVLVKSGLGDAVAARAAIKLKAGLVSGVTSLPDLSNGFKVQRAIYSGKAFATVSVNSDTKILVVRKNTVEISITATPATVESYSPVIDEKNLSAKITGIEKAGGELSLSDADIIVSGGRGMKGPEHWQPLVDLATALGAATGCSKPVSDLDWRPHHEHIGQTGIKVAPNLYIACGISGAIQHLAGVNGSKCIVVINKDPEAPFFKAADYGIVGDVFEILPKLTAAAKEL